MLVRGGFLFDFFVNLKQGRVVLEEGTSVKELAASDWPVGKFVSIFLINDCCGMAGPTGGRPTLGRWSLVV